MKSPTIAGVSTPSAGNASNRDLLEELQRDFSLFKEQRAETERLAEQESAKWQKIASELRIENAKLKVEVEQWTERHRELHRSFEGQESQKDHLMARHRELTSQLSELKTRSHESDSERTRLQHELTQLKFKFESVSGMIYL